MNVTFLGTGASTDRTYLNTAMLVESDVRILLDCGYMIPSQVWTLSEDGNFVDAIHISHAHYDHITGIVPLLAHMRQQGRTSALTIIGNPGIQDAIEELLHVTIPGNDGSFPFTITYLENTRPIALAQTKLSFAPSTHTIPSTAIRIAHGQRTVCYSGDGNYTDASAALYERCDLLIHEAISDEIIEGHGCIGEIVAMARQAQVRRLALVHLGPEVRERLEFELKQLEQSTDIDIIIPHPLHTITV
ncbi:MAG: ribonuclease Z [Nanoarchaeota archaeon]